MRVIIKIKKKTFIIV